MSSIAVSGNTSGTGEFSLEAPATTADRNITLADVSGNVVISDGTTITADYTNNRFSFGGTVVFNGLTTGFNRWQILNANTNLVANKNYFANTQTTLTLTLPATANIGDTIRVFDNEGYASANVVTISRNGNKIDGFDRNVVISTDRDGVELVYVGPEVGFITRDQQSERLAFSTFQGSVSGYTSGGSPLPTSGTIIDKFPFASSDNATDIGDLSLSRTRAAGQSSSTSGYTSGGQDATPGTTDTIDKFPFSTDSNATDVGNLSQSRVASAGQSSSAFGYSSGGGFIPPPLGQDNVIDKFPFATDTNASDVGDLSQTRQDTAGQSSSSFGYTAGGYTGPPASRKNTVDKFPFASDSNATDVGDLTGVRQQLTGQSSESNGYVSGGFTVTPAVVATNIIEKFSFASDENVNDVGDLVALNMQCTGQSSTSDGYVSGGYSGFSPPSTDLDIIQKFPFASDTNAVDTGANLSAARKNMAGQQV